MKAWDSSVVGLLSVGVIDIRVTFVTFIDNCGSTGERENMTRKTEMCILEGMSSSAFAHKESRKSCGKGSRDMPMTGTTMRYICYM
jgi:hypothetical protein